ncbi:MAG: helix-turn-helix transcriptional regulator, partial [Clostridia bacterium]|nr:helix-turn-helix transcriptional regulator [Clostridia bacterium]
MSDFSVRLVALRQQKGYSQEQLAFKMGVTKQTISNYERGLRSPDREMMENLA